MPARVIAMSAGRAHTPPMAVSVHRYSRGHVTGHLAVAGRGLYFSRTPDGTWWQLRLRTRRCETTLPGDWENPPPGAGSREPRRPIGPGPAAGAVRIERPT